jgi:sugar phosphate isomerase/epimerase
LDDLETDPGLGGTDSAGQSGDTQGLSHEAEAADESVAELADTAQAYEAGIIEGVEDADNHPGRPVHTHEDQAKTADIPPQHR